MGVTGTEQWHKIINLLFLVQFLQIKHIRKKCEGAQGIRISHFAESCEKSLAKISD